MLKRIPCVLYDIQLQVCGFQFTMSSRKCFQFLFSGPSSSHMYLPHMFLIFCYHWHLYAILPSSVNWGQQCSELDHLWRSRYWNLNQEFGDLQVKVYIGRFKVHVLEISVVLRSSMVFWQFDRLQWVHVRAAMGKLPGKPFTQS